MRLPRYRWLLPAGHLLIDGLILAVFIAHAHRETARGSRPQPRRTIEVVQEGSTVSWDPATLPIPAHFVLLATGNMPAAWVSLTLRPEAHVQSRTKLWDPVWFLIHESISFPVWFLAGFWIDSARSPIKRVMQFYLAARAGFAALALVPGAARTAGTMQIAFWLGLAIIGIGWIVFGAMSRLRTAR
jgi:hypothetical protein